MNVQRGDVLKGQTEEGSVRQEPAVGGDRIDVLVAQYESTEHSIRDASPAEMLAFLSTANVAKLAKCFRVSPAVFIAEPASQP